MAAHHTAQPNPRETRKPDFPAVVHTYTDALRILRDQGPADVVRLAEATSRDKSNMRRDVQRLRDAGVITADAEAWTITDKGRQWVAGQDVAEGAAAPDVPAARWPIDQIRPNPANRQVDPATLPDLALSIIGAGDILQPLILTPPDANGVRMILAGERRWRAACKLAAETTLDGLGIAAGLPFVEREATAAEALLITVIENSQRQDLSPWDDAQLLLQLQQATDWNATELARHIGRAGDGERSGVRDVQTKLKVAREASPAAIAAYLDNRSWDQLRNSVSQPKAPTLSEALAESGPAVMAPPPPTPLEEAIDAAPPQPELQEPLTVDAKLALIEVAWAEKWMPFHADGQPSVLTDGYLYRSAPLSLILRHGLIEYRSATTPGGVACVVNISVAGEKWLADNLGGRPSANTLFEWRDQTERRDPPDEKDEENFFTPALNAKQTRERLLRPALPGPHVVNGVDYGNATRANEARYAAGILQRPRPNGGSSPRRDEPPHEPVAPTRTPEQDLPFRTPETGSPPPLTRTEDAGLSAALQVLMERVDYVLTALKAERTADGVVAIEGDDADWMVRELEEATAWAEGALADASDVFDPSGPEIARPSLTEPAVPIRKSITPDHIVCLEDGRRFKSLKRHLRTRYNLSPEEYRAKWGLPADYPMVAPNYAKAREDLARRMGLR